MFGQRKPPGMGPPPDIRGNPQGPPGYVAQASRPEGVGGVVQSSTHTGMPTRPKFNPNAGQGVSRRPNPTVPRPGFKGGNPGQQQAQGGPPQQPVQPGPPIDFFNVVRVKAVVGISKPCVSCTRCHCIGVLFPILWAEFL